MTSSGFLFAVVTLLTPSAALVPTTPGLRQTSVSPCVKRVAAPPLMDQRPRIERPKNNDAQDEAEARERDSLYSSPSFELDATTITAILGALIAFQFFVLGNM